MIVCVGLYQCIHVRWGRMQFTEVCFFFQAEDGIRDLVRSRGLGDVYKRQDQNGKGSRGGFGRFAGPFGPI